MAHNLYFIGQIDRCASRMEVGFFFSLIGTCSSFALDTIDSSRQTNNLAFVGGRKYFTLDQSVRARV
jgi:hypothetical protein